MPVTKALLNPALLSWLCRKRCYTQAPPGFWWGWTGSLRFPRKVEIAMSVALGTHYDPFAQDPYAFYAQARREEPITFSRISMPGSSHAMKM